MNFFVIRHIPTGRLLPARVPASGYDFSRLERAREPRLFSTERAAKNCATCWAQGVWSAATHEERDGWEQPPYLVQDLPCPQPVAGRSRDQLEVLPATLLIQGLP